MQIAVDGHQPSTYILSLWLPGHSYEYRTPERARESASSTALGTVSGAKRKGRDTALSPIFLQHNPELFRARANLAEEITLRSLQRDGVLRDHFKGVPQRTRTELQMGIWRKAVTRASRYSANLDPVSEIPLYHETSRADSSRNARI